MHFLEKCLREKVRRASWSLVWGRMRRERMIGQVNIPHMARYRDQGGSPGLDVSKSWGSTPYPLLITSLAWSTGEPRSTACDKGVGEHCRLRI